ncbi:MAG: Hsp33 family molecular chaperone HslO [Desulfamplus sp.]|nr:Hsp33 family molecular chaperone HslO [Desulfamplus sp.]
MIKKDIYQGNLKDQLKASAKDRLHRFILADGMLRGAIVNSTCMVNQMRANHELGPMETLILGQAYIAAALLTASLKGRDRISMHIECSGKLNGLDVESNAFGEVRGYLKNPNFSNNLSGRESTLSSLFGAGFLTVTKYLEDAKTPYSGKIMLEYGSIAEDLANYFVQSEQTPTAFSLSVHFNEQQEVDGAGGIFLQAMPDAQESKIAEAEDIIRQISLTTETDLSIGAAFAKDIEPDHIVLEKFEKMTPLLLGNYRTEFFCRCNQNTMQRYISRLPVEDLIDIAQNGPFPLEIRCHHCNTVYNFSQPDIECMLKGC